MRATRHELHSLEDLIVESTINLGYELVTDLIAKKIAGHGFKLSRRQRVKIQKGLSTGTTDSLTFRFHGTKIDKKLSLELTPQEIEEIVSRLNRVTDVVPEATLAAVDQLTPLFERELKRGWPAWSKWDHRVQGGFRNRLARRWRVPLKLLSMVHAMCFEIGSDINAALAPSDVSRPQTAMVLTRLHARACQITSEIILLLFSGFADGAMARWRSLHEIAVTAFFVWENGEEMAEKYLLHSGVESYLAATQYNAFCKKLGERKIHAKTLSNMKRDFDALMVRFGKAYRNQYGWAAGVIGKDRPLFADIEKAVRSEHIRPYYKLASYNVHASSKGILYRLGLVDENATLLAGPSNFGLSEPGYLTARSMTQVTLAVAGLLPALKVSIALKVLGNLVEEVGASFAKVQYEIKQEELKAGSALRRTSGKRTPH